MEQKVFLFNSTWIKLEFPSGLLNENNKLFASWLTTFPPLSKSATFYFASLIYIYIYKSARNLASQGRQSTLPPLGQTLCFGRFLNLNWAGDGRHKRLLALCLHTDLLLPLLLLLNLFHLKADCPGCHSWCPGPPVARGRPRSSRRHAQAGVRGRHAPARPNREARGGGGGTRETYFTLLFSFSSWKALSSDRILGFSAMAACILEQRACILERRAWVLNGVRAFMKCLNRSQEPEAGS